MDNIGEKIKKIRELRNYPRKHVARELMISCTSYGKIERDEVDITVKRLSQIAKVLNVSMCTIIEFDGDKLFANR